MKRVDGQGEANVIQMESISKILKQMSRYFKNTSKFTGTIREPQVLTKIQKSKNLPELQPTMFRLTVNRLTRVLIN